MRVAHRRGVAEGVIVGAAIAGSRRPPAAVVVPAPYYGAGAPMAAAAATGAVYGAAAATAARPPMVGAYPPPNPGYYPPPPMQPGMDPYASAMPYPAPNPYPAAAPPPMVAPAAAPPPYLPPPVAPTVIVEPAAPAAVPAAAVVAAGAVKAAEVKAAEAAIVVKAFEKRPCFIVNEATNSVLEVRRGNVKPGAEVALERRHKDRPRHQQWYLDEGGVIHSCLNEFVIESKATGEHLRMMPYTGDARQKWTVQNNRLVNAVFCNDCIGLKKGLIRLKDDADVISCPYEGKPYQHWRIEFI